VKPKHRRLVLYVTGLVLVGAAAALVLSAFEDSIVFFHSPSDVIAAKAPTDRPFRLGGLVAAHSVKRVDGATTVSFDVTDGAKTVHVTYDGILPDLFREGQGVVAEGRLDGDGVFVADDVLAKHDEKYMPPEVAEALKKSGHWQGEAGQ
jgi:cytochrome c-type biogenesis protein CcmE